MRCSQLLFSRSLLHSVVSLFILTTTLVPFRYGMADTSPPVLLHEPEKETIAEGSAFELSAVITDDIALDFDAIELNFRTMSGGDFEIKKMVSPDGKTFVYKFAGSELVRPGLDYFITAKDLAGNTQSSGFSYFPHKLNVGPAESGPAVAESKKSNTWLYVAGAVLAAGAIAAAASSGGGSDGEEITVPFTFN